MKQKILRGILCGLLAFCLHSLVEGVRYVERRARFEAIAAVLLKIQVAYYITLRLFVKFIDVSKNLSIFHL